MLIESWHTLLWCKNNFIFFIFHAVGRTQLGTHPHERQGKRTLGGHAHKCSPFKTHSQNKSTQTQTYPHTQKRIRGGAAGLRQKDSRGGGRHSEGAEKHSERAEKRIHTHKHQSLSAHSGSITMIGLDCIGFPHPSSENKPGKRFPDTQGVDHRTCCFFKK